MSCTGNRPPPAERRAILRRAKTIAVVGASANPARASNFVLTYLLSSSADYEVWPVTPNEDEILGVQALPVARRPAGRAGHRRRLPPRRPAAGRRARGGRGRRAARSGCSSGCTATRRCEIAHDGRPGRRLQPLREDRARPLPRRPAPRGLRHRRHLLQAHPWLRRSPSTDGLTLESGAHARAARDRLRDATATRRSPVGLHLPRADRRRRGGGLVGHADRPGQGGRHRPLLRHLREPARRLQGHDRAVVDRTRRRASRTALDFPLFTDPRPGRPCTARCCARSASSGCTRRSAARSAACRSCSGRSTIPDEIERAVLVCATRAADARRTSRSRKVARARDPARHDAMDVARMMAHITYLSEEGMERKFDRARRGAGRGDDAGARTSRSSTTSTTRRRSSSPASTRARTCTCRG